MANIGEVLAASRYGALATGPFFTYRFETQEGIPVDGSNATARNLSPFTIRILPPDILLRASEDPSDSTFNPTILGAAAKQADGTTFSSAVANALGRTSAMGDLSDTGLTTNLETFVANGKLNMGQNTDAIPTLADAWTAADIGLQLRTILTVPPLTMLINPASLTINYNKLQNFSSRTRYGYVFQTWGEDNPQMSFSGSTGTFIAGAVDTANPYGAQVTGMTKSPSGAQYASKRNSAAWQNLLSLFQFYKNNGYIYDTLGKSEAHLMIGALAIDWDQWTYVGHMDAFTITYDEGTQNNATFDIQFVVSRIYDWAQTPASVAPLSGPTASPTSYNNWSTRSSSAVGLRAASTALKQIEGEDIAQVPLQLLGEW